MMNTEEKRRHMFSLVEDWRSSGLTQKAFSTLRGIKVATLSYWIARSRDIHHATGRFSELPLHMPSAPHHIEIIYPSGVRLKVANDLALITQLIRL